MKRLIIILLTACSLFYGCQKEETILKGSIYGQVMDDDGKPVACANVSLLPYEETTLTGNDGFYEFINVEDGDYSITVSKAEYTDMMDNQIQVQNGNRVRCDLLIKKIPSNFRITDVEGNDITFLDFGSDLYTTTKSFNIFNSRTTNLNCSITYSCDWVISVSSFPNDIHTGQNVTVSVEIDRSKLVAGNNVTNLYISSNYGSRILELRATGQENHPNVLTLPTTNRDGTQGNFMNTFHAKVTNAGYPPYTSKGFCWSWTNTAPTINDDSSVVIPGNGIGEYSYTCRTSQLPWEANTYVYVRAWIKSGVDNRIIYGDIQSYIYYDTYWSY